MDLIKESEEQEMAMNFEKIAKRFQELKNGFFNIQYGILIAESEGKIDQDDRWVHTNPRKIDGHQIYQLLKAAR